MKGEVQIPDVPPGAKCPESVFQLHIIRALNAPHRATRVWRQNSGVVTLRDRGGRATGQFHGAVTGAADVSGLISPSGRRLEIELKVDHQHTPQQVDFGRIVERMGGLYVLIRYEHSKSLAENVAAGVKQVDEAIGAM